MNAIAKTIRVAHILPRLTAGGAEMMAAQLALHSGTEINPLLISLKQPDASAAGMIEQLRTAGIAIHVIGQRHAADVAAIFKLAELLRRECPNVVHAHLFGGELYGCLAARRAGIDAIVSTEHSARIEYAGLRALARTYCLGLIKKVVAVSRAVAASLAKEGKLRPGQLEVIPNGIDTTHFRVAHQQQTVFMIGTIGRLEAEKDQVTLIKAMALLDRYPDLRCELVGDGSQRQVLLELIEKTGQGERIKLRGYQSDTPGFLSTLDVFVLPSRWEGMPVALLEAGAAALPVIASRLPAIEEIINEGQDGLLFEAGDAADLAAQIETLYKDRNKATKLGGNLRDKVISQYDISATAAAYEALYRSLLSI